VKPRTMIEEEGGKSEKITDPHAWQSLANGKLYVANIRDALNGDAHAPVWASWHICRVYENVFPLLSNVYGPVRMFVERGITRLSREFVAQPNWRSPWLLEDYLKNR
jgi:hypothetical protein